jgi:WD40 repeat protein
MKIWNVETRELISTIRGQPNVIFSLAFSPDGKLLAAGCADSTVRLWQVAPLKRAPVPDNPFLPAKSP